MSFELAHRAVRLILGMDEMPEGGHSRSHTEIAMLIYFRLVDFQKIDFLSIQSVFFNDFWKSRKIERKH